MTEPSPQPPISSADQEPSLFGKKWVRVSMLAAGTAAVLYGMVYLDVVLRARHACLEGQKYERWAGDPGEKKAALDAEFEKGKQELQKRLDKKKIDQEEYDRRLEVLEFDREFKMEESSLKYAFVWYQTAYELFSPPESKWVRLAREKAPAVKERWRAELRAKKIPFEETMLE